MSAKSQVLNLKYKVKSDGSLICEDGVKYTYAERIKLKEVTDPDLRKSVHNAKSVFNGVVV
jgi:hypothetical protein